MRDLASTLLDRLADGPAALARVVSTSGPAPRQLGAAMAVTADGGVIGSLSAGCIDSAIVHTAADVLHTGHAVTERFGTTDADDIAIGLTCGGEIEIFVERVDETRIAQLAELISALERDRPVALATTLTTHPEWRLTHPHDAEPWQGLDADVANRLAQGCSGIVGVDDTECPPEGTARPRTFVQTFASARRLILVGANDFVRALATVGATLGFHVTVVDPRPVFVTTARFPDADDVVVAWPDRYLAGESSSGRTGSTTVVCVMTHDAKVDVPALSAALAGGIGFVGALGSRRTHRDRVRRLVEEGVADEQIACVRSPLGLDLGGHSPQEVAISIAAQLIAERHGGSGRSLRELRGPIHRPDVPPLRPRESE
ncbi:XdhC family protein [Gordonia sp. OPL2]|uniref:XdhC family protein n=1 Tax=Gordonia sp. OPL2 TaxID=2486274 RepID=UPI0016562CE5|nr:XdhC/CoxI family protein [Gordonia sp. OPL2]ROZ89341.1 XdhC/CoxI family protein [Gordonia sp. OPL2]